MEDRPGMPRDEWLAYFDAVAGLPARETLLLALERFESPRSEQNRDRKGAVNEAEETEGPDRPGLLAHARGPAGLFAIDLGCGDGRDTVELLRRGWRVLAIDSSPEAVQRLKARWEGVSDRHPLAFLETRLARFEETPLPPADLVNASFSIPHCSPADFPPMWSRIVDAIRPGGRFAGQLFGVNDSWARKPDGIIRTYHTREQVDAMLAPFEVELLDEVERPGKNALGEPKYWHAFHIVARKR
jgi:tellurite methyltransferase